MHILSDGSIVTDSSKALDTKTQALLDARIYFYNKPFTSFTILKDYLEMAKDEGKLDSAKELKKKEIVMNGFISETPDFFKDNKILDTSRMKAFTLIEGIL